MLILTLCACALGIAAACGGTGTKTLTKEQYAAKVSHLCLVAAEGFHQLHIGIALSDWRDHATEITSVVQHFNRSLAALTPPPEVAHAATPFVSANKKVLKDDLAAVAAAKAGDAGKLHAALVRGNMDVGATYQFAEAIGATGCYPS